MKVWQYYYTSYINQATGSAGFQIKAMSPDISPEIQSIIPRLIGYRIPPTLDERRIETHPIALRYYYMNKNECVLLCSQSCGPDPNGRPGNFFAHTVVLEPEIFSSVPPIFYWRSSFWKKQDRESRTRIDSLPVLPAFDEEPSLDSDAIWEFLQQGKRREHLRKLLSAVVDSGRTQRRIVILDTVENIVLWIAAVSTLLPPNYRPLLTFATYHHDPYQAQYLITGTTRDSSFRASAEEYMTYFILDGERGKTSDDNVEDSLYAKIAVEAASPDLYETNMLRLFTEYVPFFPAPTVIDEQLDRIAHYYELLNDQRKAALNKKDLAAISTVVAEFEQRKGAYTQDDKNQVELLESLLWKKFKTSLDARIQNEHQRVLVLMKQLELLTNTTLVEMLRTANRLILQTQNQEIGFNLISAILEVWGEQVLIAALNGNTYQQWLLSDLSPSSDLILFWQHLGKFLRHSSPQSQHLLLISLQTIEQLVEEQQRDEEKYLLLSAICQAIISQERAWLQIAVSNAGKLSNKALFSFYYYMIPMDLDQRIPYRKILSPLLTEGLLYEIRKDVYDAVDQELAILERWVIHAQQQRYELAPLITASILALQEKYLGPKPSPQHKQRWREAALQILENNRLAPLPQETKALLLRSVFETLTLANFPEEGRPHYKKYCNDPSLHEEKRILLGIIVALTSGKLKEQQARQLHKHIESLTTLDKYTKVCESCISAIFRHNVSSESHYWLVEALLSSSRRFDSDPFWDFYQLAFCSAFGQLSTVQRAVGFLDFWFTTPPTKFTEPYVVQNFFLRVPRFQCIKESRTPSHVLHEFRRRAKDKDWYSSVEDLFSERKSMLAQVIGVVGKNVLRIGQKRNVSPSEASDNVSPSEASDNVSPSEASNGESQGKGKVVSNQEKMGEFFSDKDAIYRTHTRLPALHQELGREQFWQLYWKQVSLALMTERVDFILALLSFWFDQSFKVFKDSGFFPQEFFLGLYETLETCSKSSEFSKVAYTLHWKVQREQRRYPWYFLVRQYFGESKK